MEATPSNQPEIKHQLTADQESEVFNWVSEERNGVTIVRKDLVLWFAERVLQRDGCSQSQALPLHPGFTDDFFDRHPELAKRLIDPPPPVPELRPTAEEGVRLGAIARMKMLSWEARTMALYGDSPPPPRKPVPYPEGEVIHHSSSRYVVRHGSTVTKYTTYSHGMGQNEHPSEAMAMRYVKANTTIPAPTVISSDWDRITMEYIEGKTLKQAWPVLTSHERANILDELRGYIAQLRALRGGPIGRIDGQGVVLPSIIPRSGGPFNTVAEMHHWLVRPPRRSDAQSMYWHQITTQLAADYPVVFTHGDIAARNVLVRDGRIVAVLDWEFAGWYPEYWDYVFTLRGMDNIDWDTLGSQVPSLFAKRYDLEYILVQFIISCS